MQAVVTISSSMVGALQFYVSLVIEGVGNRTMMVAYYDTTAPGSYREIPVDITINYSTGILTAGTYTVGIYWRSRYE